MRGRHTREIGVSSAMKPGVGRGRGSAMHWIVEAMVPPPDHREDDAMRRSRHSGGQSERWGNRPDAPRHRGQTKNRLQDRWWPWRSERGDSADSDAEGVQWTQTSQTTGRGENSDRTDRMPVQAFTPFVRVHTDATCGLPHPQTTFRARGWLWVAMTGRKSALLRILQKTG